jgi:hypothetical protein
MVDLQRLVIPLPPSKNLFGKKSREYFQRERERFMSSLQILREQEKVLEVSTSLVLQVIISGWVLLRKFETIRDKELIEQLRGIKDLAANYGFLDLWKSRYYSELVQTLNSRA